MSSQYKCCFCGRWCSGYGNNPEPILPDGKNKCCDDCNFGIVVPRRLHDFQEEAKKEKKKK